MNIVSLLLLALQDPPSITYGGTRTSKAWIQTPGGMSVAVDEGVEWQGVKVYLSLTSELIGVDPKTGKAIWAEDVGAFWNRVTFAEIEAEPGKKIWAVELRPGKDEREGGDKAQHHDLKTGRVIPPKEKPPEGTGFKPRKEWKGAHSQVAARFRLLVGTKENWERVVQRMFEEQKDPAPPEFGEIDWEKEVVLVVSDGDGWNCDGISCEGAWESESRILVRLRHHYYQTAGPDGGGVKVRPFGVFVLPRREGRAIVVERNAQNFIGGPAIWKETWRLDKPAAPEKELDGLPR
jgi:hypothetical protein